MKMTAGPYTDSNECPPPRYKQSDYRGGMLLHSSKAREKQSKPPTKEVSRQQKKLDTPSRPYPLRKR
jgi:hypothetical protein